MVAHVMQRMHKNGRDNNGLECGTMSPCFSVIVIRSEDGISVHDSDQQAHLPALLLPTAEGPDRIYHRTEALTLDRSSRSAAWLDQSSVSA